MLQPLVQETASTWLEPEKETQRRADAGRTMDQVQNSQLILGPIDHENEEQGCEGSVDKLDVLKHRNHKALDGTKGTGSSASRRCGQVGAHAAAHRGQVQELDGSRQRDLL